MFHRHKRRIGVPRGMLFHIAMVLLRDGPKSGSELSDLIEEYTDWRPSPGSMYPLLNKLHESGMIEPHSDDDPSLKRFVLTEKGQQEIAEHPSQKEEYRKRNRIILRTHMRLVKRMSEELFNSYLGVVEAIEDTWEAIDEPQMEEFRDILNDTAAKLNKIGKRHNEPIN